MYIARYFTLSLLLVLTLASSGCATITTTGQPAHERKPLVMSGLRLNLASLNNDLAVSEKFGVSPPDFPLLDLPFSTFLDLLVLGYTVPMASYYQLR